MDIVEIAKWAGGIFAIVCFAVFIGWGLFAMNAGREP